MPRPSRFLDIFQPELAEPDGDTVAPLPKAFIELGIGASQIEQVIIEFGEWLPDVDERDNPGATLALNVIPADGSYVPFRDFASSDVALASRNFGAAVVKGITAEYLYAGITGGVYIRTGATYTNVYTPVPSVSEDYYWQFVPFGDNVVAIHAELVPHAGEVGAVTPFSPLGGDPPTAACGAQIGNFLVLGNLTEDPDDPAPTDPRPRRIRWSGFNNIDAPWVTDEATQADFNDMPAEGGHVIGITGREVGYVFQEKMISRMTYVGLPTVFDIQTVEENRGAVSRDCIIDVGERVYYLAEDGFFLWNGVSSEPIGADRVNKFFYNDLNYDMRHRIVGAVDYVNSCVVWAYPAGTSEVLNRMIVYSYVENRWSYGTTLVEYIFSDRPIASSLDFEPFDDMDLDTDFPESLDSFGGARNPTLAGFGAESVASPSDTHAYGTFTGPPQEARIDTAEWAGPKGQRWFVNSVRPIVDVSLPVCYARARYRDEFMGADMVYSEVTYQEFDGTCPILVDARYMGIEVVIPRGAAWQHARGVEVSRKTTGR